MMRGFGLMLAFGLLAACSGFTDKNGAEDAREGGMAAALEKALAEAESGENEAETSKAASEEATLVQSDTGSPDVSADEDLQSTALSTENLREGVPDGMGSPYGMCVRTLSIVGEHCGCMVNRAMDAGINGGVLVRLFGGDGSRATPYQAEQFTRIVRSCAGYNVTVRNAGAAVEPSDPADREPAASAAPRNTQAKVRRVACYFRNGIGEYDGPCNFVTGPGGDFVTTSLNGEYFDGVTQIGLDVTAKGRGQLQFYYPDGVVRSSYVERSTTDRACWEGSGAVFCAR
ncbi:MAG: hypothetical protein AAFZ11_15230 [Pseudomonadota bacterium]